MQTTEIVYGISLDVDTETPIPESVCARCDSAIDVDGRCVDCGYYDGGFTADWMKANAVRIVGRL